MEKETILRNLYTIAMYDNRDWVRRTALEAIRLLKENKDNNKEED